MCCVMGCGSGASSEADQVAQTLRTAYTSIDGSGCRQMSTQRSVEQYSQEKGHAALKLCVHDELDPANDASSVRVSDVRVNGNVATAHVLLHGTGLDGSTIEQRLIRQNGRWKVDEISGFVHFDPVGYRDHVAAQAASEGVPASGVACLRAVMAAAPIHELEATVLSSSPNAVNQLIKPCTR